jgi:hypothetical protein
VLGHDAADVTAALTGLCAEVTQTR